jgi:hypothetical protein
MSTKRQPIDVADSAELLDLAEEVRPSGVGQFLKRGDQELALLMPVAPRRTARSRRPTENKRDALLTIIGIGEPDEPTDIGRHELEYLADAYVSAR